MRAISFSIISFVFMYIAVHNNKEQLRGLLALLSWLFLVVAIVSAILGL